ncbi:hypothetical protein G3T14_22085 [Methylobacterium sp. BTF04]|uniref:hypothetical protein n=1 Tax=Methylobacterium sp. BTF04 TaxID=2708300 RepID=UPI0013D23F5C|nr:hypothetical protein [Methylobacterium sp. BTF04]NEU14769.1 hypothetical protein [Methylobacterium sp. BTF04]
MAEPTLRRYPAPWTVVEHETSFQIHDANGAVLAHVLFGNDLQHQNTTNRITKDEARRIAISMAAVPELRRALRD